MNPPKALETLAVLALVCLAAGMFFDAAALSAWRAQKWMLEVKAKGFAFSGEEFRQAGNKLRPGDLGINPEISPMSMVRVAERMRAMERTAVPIIPGTGGILLPPRIAARRGRF